MPVQTANPFEPAVECVISFDGAARPMPHAGRPVGSRGRAGRQQSAGKAEATRTPMSDDLIRYDVLTQEALRGVIRKVLDEVAAAGLPGEHHFFITFDTTHPGVRLSARMRERYPETMTIVIQHTFWNLETSDSGFEVDLTFNDIRERLRIPWGAVQAFFDPSVKFGLQFEIPAEEWGDDGVPFEHEVVGFPGGEHAPRNSGGMSPEPYDETTGEEAKPATPSAARKGGRKTSVPDTGKKRQPAEAKPASADGGKGSGGTKSSGNAGKDGGADGATDGGGEVVSLDSFRKKK